MGELECQKQVSRTWISNDFPHYTVGCNYLSMSYTSADMSLCKLYICCRHFSLIWSATLVWYGYPDSNVHGAKMGPIWGRQDPHGPHVGPMNIAIWIYTICHNISISSQPIRSYKRFMASYPYELSQSDAGIVTEFLLHYMFVSYLALYVRAFRGEEIFVYIYVCMIHYGLIKTLCVLDMASHLICDKPLPEAHNLLDDDMLLCKENPLDSPHKGPII